MNHTARTVSIGAVAAAAVLAFSGCGLLTPPERFSDDASLDDTVHTIEIDEPDGSVIVTGAAEATGIQVERTVSYRGERTVGETFEVDDGVLVLSGCGRNCTVDYTIELPIGVDVRGATTNGEVSLTGVNEVDVSTANGRIELDDVTGAIEVETSNGRIEGRGLAGTGIRASTSNGAIDLRLSTPQDVDARTSNGAIDLAVPTEGAGYRVTTDTSNGAVDVDIDEDSDGEFALELATSNGAITVTGR
ncbi:DUF4097 family beta strand repeat-containing protein [Agromyces aureus]|uniref:DUF4097 domain-containing protein n=1 Tax=Agromyces aureus TaxID=453304 RepID=A0A191WBI9_9MICO|nr:DUF4097 family beta strand repeat-containing protein [Agromyces aureus]ANJ25563.1 hypothetical protein ATC03_01010 [Agromyces aureus]